METIDPGTSNSSLFNLNWFEIYFPEAPVGLVASPTPATQIDPTWNHIETADSYRLMRSTPSGGGFEEIASGLTSPNFSDMNLDAGTSYFYSVSAIYGEDESGGSTESTAIHSDPINPVDVVVSSISMADNASGRQNVLASMLKSSNGCFYQLESTLGPGAVDWEELGDELMGDGGPVNFLAPVDPEEGWRFYRVWALRR